MSLRVGGLTPFTLIDFPEHLAAVVFCQGCSWRCHYCHNQHLWKLKNKPLIPWQAVVDFLQVRKGFLDAVVFSGGEPLLQKDLLAALQQVREMGFKTALHTAGSVPKRLQQVLPYLDWVGFDIKAAFADYEKITQISNSGFKAEQSLQYLLESDVAYSIRTTLDQDKLQDLDMEALYKDLQGYGVKTELQNKRSNT